MKKLCFHALLLFLLLGISLVLPGAAQADNRVDGCQCTDYVYSQRPDIPTGMGHAKDWLYSARVYRLPYDQVPQVGDVAVIINGEFGFSAEFGHVAMVTDVNEERNAFSIAGWNGILNDCRLQILHDLPVTHNTFFIHQTIDTQLTSTPYTDWPHRFKDLIDLVNLEF
jgi:surface antigen